MLRPNRKFLPVLAALCLLALLAATPAGARVRILAPLSSRAPEGVPFAVRSSGPTARIAFFADGRRRWVDRSPGREFGRAGRIGLPAGRHVLVARAVQAGGVVTVRRDVVVAPPPGGDLERGQPQSDVTDAGDISPAIPALPEDEVAVTDQPTPPEEESPPPAPEPPRPPDSAGGLLFSGSKISDFRENQSAPGAVTEVPDPAGSGKQVLQMTVDNADVAPITPTKDPRAQLLTPAFVEPGDETWWHSSFYLPEDFPSDIPGWVSILEGPYGPPFGGSPPVSISADDHELRFQRNETYGYDVAYRQPIVRGQWVDILLHTKFGREGFVELWVDGRQVTFFQKGAPANFNPSHEPETQRLDMRTMDHLNDGGPNFFVIQNYRKAGMFDSLTVYHGETRVGTTRASVEG